VEAEKLKSHVTRGKKSEARSQRQEVRGKKSEARSQKPEKNKYHVVCSEKLKNPDLHPKRGKVPVGRMGVRFLPLDLQILIIQIWIVDVVMKAAALFSFEG